MASASSGVTVRNRGEAVRAAATKNGGSGSGGMEKVHATERESGSVWGSALGAASGEETRWGTVDGAAERGERGGGGAAHSDGEGRASSKMETWRSGPRHSAGERGGGYGKQRRGGQSLPPPTPSHPHPHPRFHLWAHAAQTGVAKLERGARARSCVDRQQRRCPRAAERGERSLKGTRSAAPVFRLFILPRLPHFPFVPTRRQGPNKGVGGTKSLRSSLASAECLFCCRRLRCGAGGRQRGDRPSPGASGRGRQCNRRKRGESATFHHHQSKRSARPSNREVATEAIAGVGVGASMTGHCSSRREKRKQKSGGMTC